MKVSGNDMTLEAGSGGSNSTNLIFKTASSGTESEAMRIDSSGNVGIGTSSLTSKFEVAVSDNAAIQEAITIKGTQGGAYGGYLGWKDNWSGDSYTGYRGAIISDVPSADNGRMRFFTANSGSLSEAMRIGSTGQVLIGRTATSGVADGHRFDANGFTQHVRDGGSVLELSRETSDGDIAVFKKGTTTVGSIGNTGTTLKINGSSSGIYVGGSGAAIWPQSDDTHDLGTSGLRFDDIFATNGTIQTSDQNEKQDIASLTAAEITAAKAISKLFKTFKWQDKVAAKGDAARTHAGVIAQEVQTAMTDAGLDAADYAFWCSDTWWETSTDVPAVEADEEAGIEARDAYTRIDTYYTADEAPEGATQRTRLGIRYPELLAFIGAATEQRLADLEARVAALEAN